MRISISCGPFTEKNTVEIEKQQSHPRRAQQSRPRRQSAAVLPSLAPHGSKARLRVVSNSRSSWRSHVHRTHTAQRVQSFKLQSANVGGRGALPSRSLWGPRGPFSHVREWPPYLRTLRHAGNKVQSTALPKIFCLSAKKKERLFRGVLLIFAKVKFTDTSACRRWRGRGRRRRRW